ncbi:hypothetical protein DID88_000566 [Monilinia fructigena]|uniref:Uncharacterized protein n=1 Tax=Monilinia fructigena TaxID=38457 RepID=A0A395II81_9HELO|nr:hypothetical protein DID88_000566 [Monilinia fructigena]
MSVISRADSAEDMSNIAAPTFSPLRQGIVIKEIPHLSESPHNPPSPPITLVQALNMSPATADIPRVHDYQLEQGNRLPPTPNITPTTPMASNGFDSKA